jgi:stage V sporulation protein G
MEKNRMQITEVKVFPVAEEKLKAFVSIVIDGCFMVNDIKVIQGKDGLFISMPSRRKKNGEFKDVAHPLNSDTRRVIEGRVLGEYERIRDGRGATPPEAVAAAAEPAALETAPETVAADRSLEEVEELHLRDSFWTVS